MTPEERQLIGELFDRLAALETARRDPDAEAAPSGYGGGGFLGTAAATAAGMIGGGLMLDGIRSMLHGHQHGAFAGAFDHLSSGRALDDAAPSSGGRGSDDLARSAGLDDIG